MYSHIHSDVLEGPIRNPIQQEEVVGRAFRGSVCSLGLWIRAYTRAPLVNGVVLAEDLVHHLEDVLWGASNDGLAVGNEHRSLE
jgi:hypothetical protein